MIMDSSSINYEILKVVNVNARGLRREAKLSLESEDTELIGFTEGKMVFKRNIVDKSIKLQEVIANNSKDNPRENKRNLNEESPEKNEVSIKPIDTKVIQEVKVQKVIQEPPGKKFIFLNGKKLQIVKHSANTIQNKVEGKIIEMPKLIPKLTGVKPMLLSNKSSDDIDKAQPSIVELANQQATNISTKYSQNILPKLTGKIISINKNESLPNLSIIVKEMGGTVRLVNSQESSPLGIPHCNKNIPAIKALGQTGKLLSAGKMETSQCICVEKKNSVTVSTNTELVKTINKGVQTDILPDQSDISSDVENPISEFYSSGVIIGADVNMGHGPPPIFSVNEQHIKMKFFNDLNRCLKWESGNLPIHRGVIQQDLQEVKSQCVVLTVRKAGINITNINNYMPLQLSVINNVNIDIVKVLLEYNADLSVLDSEGNNVLHLAVEHNRTDLVRIFLDRLESCKLDINCFNYDGLTPLMMCAFHVDRIDMAEQLLKKEALLNLKDLKSGRTAIFHAAESHNTPMVLLLLDYGADTKIRNFFGTSVHDAMFELDDMPKEIKYPILGRDLKGYEKRKLHQQKVRNQETFKRTKLEIVSTIQRLESKSSFVINAATLKK